MNNKELEKIKKEKKEREAYINSIEYKEKIRKEKIDNHNQQRKRRDKYNQQRKIGGIYDSDYVNLKKLGYESKYKQYE